MLTSKVITSELITGVSVRSIKVSSKTCWRHIVLTTSSGRNGIGEFTLDGAAHAKDAAPADYDTQALIMAQKLEGAPLLEESLDLLGPLPTNSIARASIYSACSQAFIDLLASESRVSVAEYLRPGHGKIEVPIYANINRRTDERSPLGCQNSALVAIKAGFKGVKIAPFDNLTPQLCGTAEGKELIDAGLERIKAIKLVGKGEIDIMIDCHWRFSAPGITAILDLLTEAGVVWIECPLPEIQENIPALREIRALCNSRGIRLAGLETSIGWESYRPYVEGGAYDLIMPDIKHAGGYRAILEIADRAAEHGVGTSLHNPSGPVAHAASLQLTSILPNNEALEIQYDESPLFWTITTPAPPRVNGDSSVPQFHGLGLKLKD